MMFHSQSIYICIYIYGSSQQPQVYQWFQSPPTRVTLRGFFFGGSPLHLLLHPRDFTFRENSAGICSANWGAGVFPENFFPNFLAKLTMGICAKKTNGDPKISHKVIDYFLFLLVRFTYKVGPAFTIAKLVNITPITPMSLWFMVPITIVHGVYKPSYN